MSRFLTRRGVVYGIAGAAVAGGAALAGSAAVCSWTTAEVRDAADRLRVALADIIEPERLAAWWRARNTPPAAGALLAEAGLGQALRTECPDTRRALLRARVRDEFRRGDIVIADGFIVARTECLIAAVCAGEGRAV